MGTSESPAPRTYLGAYGLCVRDGQVLLVRISKDLPDAEMWTLPGGGVLWGEDPNEAVLREIREETGLEAHILGIAGIYSKVYERSAAPPHPPLQHIGIVYEFEIESGDICHEVEGTTDLCQWHAVGDVRSQRLVPLVEFVLELIDPHT